MSRTPAGALVSRGGLCARSAIIVVLGTLILAASARAAEPVSGATREAKSAAPPVQVGPEKATSVETPGEAGSESASAGEATSETGSESASPGEATSETGSESASAGEAGAEDAPPTQADEPEAPSPPPVEAVTEPPPPTPPVEAQSEPAPGPALPVEAVKEAIVEPLHLTPEAAAPGASGAEQGKEGAPTQTASGVAGEGAPPLTGGQGAAMPGVPTVAVSASESGSIGAALTTGTSIVEPAVRGAAAPASARASGAQLSAAQRAADLNCELSGLSSPDTENCTAGWLAGQSLSSTSPAYLTTAAVAATAGAPTGGAGGGTQGGSRSVTPPPGPAPSGSFGSAAAGACATAPTGFFTVGGHLRLVTPRAMRRLRLSCQPWRTAFFVLIPERPG
jgi:hypothetical protein